MRVGSLFSGIGGLDLGLERAGMEIAWQVEVDDWCTRVLKRHWPHVARFRDVRDCHGEHEMAHAEGRKQPQQPRGHNAQGTRTQEAKRPVARAGSRSDDGDSAQGTPVTLRAARTMEEGRLTPVDLICGGFPCQPVSHAGRRMGESDSRWLWPEFHRIICEVRPRWVLAENVPGLLSMDSGRLFRGILRNLSEAGYDAVWFVLSAADVGAPHLRERVFIVGMDNTVCGRRYAGTAPIASKQDSNGPHNGISKEPSFDAGSNTTGQRWTTRDGSERRHAVTSSLQRLHQQDGEDGFSGRGRISPDDGGSRGWWTTEPNVGRVAHGIPARVDRLRGLGNAVVPQVAEAIGRWIMEAQ